MASANNHGFEHNPHLGFLLQKNKNNVKTLTDINFVIEKTKKYQWKEEFINKKK